MQPKDLDTVPTRVNKGHPKHLEREVELRGVYLSAPLLCRLTVWRTCATSRPR